MTRSLQVRQVQTKGRANAVGTALSRLRRLAAARLAPDGLQSLSQDFAVIAVVFAVLWFAAHFVSAAGQL